MQQNRRNQKKNPTVLSAVIVIAVMLFAMLDELPDSAALGVVTVIMLLIPLAVVLAVVKLVKKKSYTGSHSHDRIDHTTDLKINPTTGKVESSARRTAAQHSAREHWKQQLDGLLANGTIDRAEYQAMMNRKF